MTTQAQGGERGMRLSIGRSTHWFVWPSLQIEGESWMFCWTVELWWLKRGLVLMGKPTEAEKQLRRMS